MASREEILDLIVAGNLDEALEELGNAIAPGNDDARIEFKSLRSEYINPSANYNPVAYTKRLRLFANTTEYKVDLLPQVEELNYYKAFCGLDYKKQTDHFKKMYYGKKLAAFLLHGNTDAEGNDIRWLYNQLLYTTGLTRQEPIVIDLKAPLAGSVEWLVDQLIEKFKANDHRLETLAQKRVVVRQRIESRLLNGPLVCIINNPDRLFASATELNSLFNDLFGYLYSEMNTDKGHGLILLFTENREVDYHKEPSDHFIYYRKGEENYASRVEKCKAVRIIDLAPVEPLTPKDIADWLDDLLLTRPLHDALQPVACELQNVGNPYYVISEICKKLNLEINKAWIK